MNKRLAVAVTTGALLLPAGVAMADPGTTGPPVEYFGSRTADCTAGGWYGNTTNPSGNGSGVLPSQAPGPFTNTGENPPPRNDRTRGDSIGDAAQDNQEANGNNAGGAAAACDSIQQSQP